MTEIKAIGLFTTKQLIQELGGRTTAIIIARVEDGQPAFASRGSSIIIAGLLHAARLLNDKHLLDELVKPGTKLKLATDIPPDPKPGA